MSDLFADDARVTDLPAFERVQARAQPGAPGEPRRRRAGLGALLVLLVLVGGATTAWWLWPDESADANILVHFVDAYETFRPDLLTTRPGEARELVLDALGWDVAPPEFPGLTVVGVGIPAVGQVRPGPSASPADVQVPVFRYEGSEEERALVFAYDYILLDRVRGAFDLPEGTYAGLAEPTPVDSRVVDGYFVVSWRERAMIFSAVTPNEAVAERIRQVVSS